MDSNTARQIAHLVASAIKSSGKTKASVAREALIPWTTFSRKISGQSSEFTLSELLRIAAALDIEPAALVPSIFSASKAA